MSVRDARGHGGAPESQVVDVPAVIDAQPVGRYQIGVLLLCAAVVFADGFDTQAIGYVAPALAQEWGLGKGALGPVFSAGLFGLMIGAPAFGPLADRIGRKTIIVVSTLFFGVCTLATVFAEDVTQLMLIRFITGLGLGGAMPNAIALTSEYGPHRRRATMIMVMFCGFSLGAAIGGGVAAYLIPTFGWRSVFLIGGLFPLMLVPLLVVKLPESIRFLALSGRANEQVARLLKRINPALSHPPGTRFGVHEAKLPGMPVQHLFSNGRKAATILLWVLFFMSLLDLYLLSNWLPTVLNGLGVSVSTAAIAASLLQIGGTFGTLTLGHLIDRFGPYRVLPVTYAIAAIAIAAVGLLGAAVGPVMLAIFTAGFCIVGGQIGSNAFAATYYPTAVRATGIGWCLGIGRIGSIVGPLVGGTLLTLHWPASSVFLLGAIPALCATAAAIGLGLLARRQSNADADAGKEEVVRSRVASGIAVENNH